MTIIVDVKPEVQAELARQAAAHGRAVESYAASLLEEAIHTPSATSVRAFDRERAQAAAARIRETAPRSDAGRYHDQADDR